MTVAAGDAHPFVIYNARYRAVFPIRDNDGDLVTGAAALDSEASQDQGTFADCTNEATEIATASGLYYLDLIATELDTKCTAVIVKTTTTDAKTTALILHPRRFPVLRTGTAQAGAATTITLDATASAIDDFYRGMYVNITNDSPANARGQARRIISYVGSTKVATVEAAWGTNPSSASTFEILLVDDGVGNVAAIGGNPNGATRLERAARAMTLVTVGAASTTTSVVTSSMAPAAAVADQFKNAVLVFDMDTTTANLRGQRTRITGSTAGGVLTVSPALTTAPASGDTAVIV
jgi:hypothetical protein